MILGPAFHIETGKSAICYTPLKIINFVSSLPGIIFSGNFREFAIPADKKL